MNHKVQEFVQQCNDCQAYVDKKTQEPIKHHKVPNKCWETVSVDLYGPMPSNKHVVVVQDLASRFPTAKLVSSTKADKVIPALKEMYNTYGNPDTQISDNGPPFNSMKMSQFAKDRDINMRLIPPLHPSSNPVENFMRPLGKGMKIGAGNGRDERETLNEMLGNYQQTPHPATGIPPVSMMFRDGFKSKFPRQVVSENQVTAAKLKDLQGKKRS